jgi:hypothetical protein
MEKVQYLSTISCPPLCSLVGINCVLSGAVELCLDTASGLDEVEGRWGAKTWFASSCSDRVLAEDEVAADLVL